MSAFDTVYTAYRPRVERLAYKLTGGAGNNTSLEELSAAGMVALWQAHTSYDPTHGTTFWQYAYRIVWGTMVDEMRLHGHLSRNARAAVRDDLVTDKMSTSMLYQRPVENAYDLAALGDPEEDLQLKEASNFVKLAFEHLRGRERRVIFEHYFEDRKLRDIATELDVTESRVCQLKMSALETMAGILAKRRNGHSVGELETRASTISGSETKGRAIPGLQPRKKRNPRYLVVDGVTKRLCDWAQDKGLSASVILARLKKGWSAEKAVGPLMRQRGGHGTSVRGLVFENTETSTSEFSPAEKQVLDLCKQIFRYPDAVQPLRSELEQLLKRLAA
jgi:RNA polymerase sigma factor for flagellar operon FliA